MINVMQKAIIKKDLQVTTSNKQVMIPVLVVPIVLTIVIPSIFILIFHFMPEEISDIEKLLALLPMAEQTGSMNQTIIKLLMNNIMPVFFLMIPIMASSVMAASSFVGKKEKRTLETLLYCPLPLPKLFQAKILASFLMSMIVSFASFFCMMLVMEIEIVLTLGSFVLPSISWLIIMFLVSPAISLIAITAIVRGSAKAQTAEESQQRTVFLILPVLLLVIGQFTGILLVSTWILLGLGIVLALIASLLMRGAMGTFNYELLLR